MEITSTNFDRDIDFRTFAEPEMKPCEMEPILCTETLPPSSSEDGWERLKTETQPQAIQEEPLDIFELCNKELMSTPVGEKLIASFHADSHRASLQYLREALSLKEFLTPVHEGVLHLYCVQVLVQMKEYEQALQEELLAINAFMKGLQETPDLLQDLDVDVMHLEHGGIQLYFGNKEKGIAALKEAQKMGNPQAAFLLKALEALDPVAPQAISDTLPLGEQARLYFIQGQYEKALQCAAAACAESPKKVDLDEYNQFRAACYALRGDFDEAFAIYLEAVLDDPFGDTPYGDLALLYAMKGDRANAQMILDEWLDKADFGPDILKAFALKKILS